MDGFQMNPGYEFLKKGRKPYASAILRGGRASLVKGEIFFYDTPLGILMSAQIEGLPRFNGIYEFDLEGDERERGTGQTGRCFPFPLVYARNGKGSASCISETLRRIPLCGHRILLRESRKSLTGQANPIAEGVIQSG
ncbi:MAG: hypothetical protein IKA76_03650 [Clostridia bacterium]|nr:hypothetical protein [Clostridia bacterium]